MLEKFPRSARTRGMGIHHICSLGGSISALYYVIVYVIFLYV